MHKIVLCILMQKHLNLWAISSQTRTIDCPIEWWSNSCNNNIQYYYYNKAEKLTNFGQDFHSLFSDSLLKYWRANRTMHNIWNDFWWHGTSVEFWDSGIARAAGMGTEGLETDSPGRHIIIFCGHFKIRFPTEFWKQKTKRHKLKSAKAPTVIYNKIFLKNALFFGNKAVKIKPTLASAIGSLHKTHKTWARF